MDGGAKIYLLHPVSLWAEGAQAVVPILTGLGSRQERIDLSDPGIQRTSGRPKLSPNDRVSYCKTPCPFHRSERFFYRTIVETPRSFHRTGPVGT